VPPAVLGLLLLLVAPWITIRLAAADVAFTHRLLGTPGRLSYGPGAALGAVLGFGLVGWTGFQVVGLAAQASFPVSYAVPVSGGVVHADIVGGRVIVRPGPARLTGRMHFAMIASAPDYRVTPGGTVLSYDCQIPSGQCQLNATLGLPVGDGLDLSTDGGDITVVLPPASGGYDLSIASGGGTVRVAGDVRRNPSSPLVIALNSGGGDITVTEEAGP
jgi:hypothetical protein